MKLALATLDIYLEQNLIYIMVLWLSQLFESTFGIFIWFIVIALLFFLNKMLGYPYACL